MFISGVEVLSFTLKLKTGTYSIKLSISIWFKEDIVGNVKSKTCWECIFAEEKKNLFPKFLISTTIQDGNIRKRRNKYNIFTFF